MKLSVALGKSISEVGAMPAYELAVYEIADGIQPIGEYREDLRHARLVNEIRASGGRTPKKLKDLLIEFDPPSVVREKLDRADRKRQSGEVGRSLARQLGLSWKPRESING